MRKHAITICISSSVLLHCHKSHSYRINWKIKSFNKYKISFLLLRCKAWNYYLYIFWSFRNEICYLFYYLLHCILSFLRDVRYFWRLGIILKGKEWFMCHTCELLHAPNTLLCITCQLMLQPFYQCSRQDLKELFPTQTSLWIFQIFSPGIWYYQVWQCAAHGEKIIKIHPILKSFSCPLYQSFFCFC